MKGDNRILENYTREIFKPSDIISITSHAKTGKTSLLLEIANNRAISGELVLWFDTSDLLNTGHLHNDVVLVKGVKSIKEIVKIASVLQPQYVVVDDVSKLKSFEIGKMSQTLKLHAYRNSTTFFLVHQIRNNPNLQTKYFHNMPEALSSLVSIKCYMERYYLKDLSINIVKFTTKRAKETAREILIPISTKGIIPEEEMILHFSERFNLVPPANRVTTDRLLQYLEDNQEDLVNKIKENLSVLNNKNYSTEKDMLIW